MKPNRIAVTLLALAVTTAAASQPSFRARQEREAEAQMLKFNQFYHYLNALYVDTLDNGSLVESAIREVLSQLDPHSAYVSVDEMKDVSESFGGSFSGIGVEYDVLSDTVTVVNTVAGGPAEAAGILPNDKIVEVDGKPVVGITRTDVPKLLRGKKGTVVEVGIVRHGMTGRLPFRIRRDDIPIYTVDAAYTIGDTIGYIKVNRFAETTMDEFGQAFDELGDINALILDLRSNGGGLMNQALMLSEFFLPTGALLMSTEGRNVPETRYEARSQGRFTRGPVVVLTDASSASGSEIVAGAIQDWDRGLVIGQPTFGKGLVQRQLMLPDGSAVRVTVARYHTPTGRVIQRPFEPGKPENYYMDHLRRAIDSSYVDSMMRYAPRYRTLRSGRTVTGGGGIYPDIYIPLDTTKNYSYWGSLVRGGIINEYVNTYLETRRQNLLRRYPGFEEFDASYEVTPEMLAEIRSMAEKRGIPYKKDDSEGMTGTHVKALIARKLWSPTEYFRIINRADDKEFARALEVLSDWNGYTGGEVGGFGASAPLSTGPAQDGR